MADEPLTMGSFVAALDALNVGPGLVYGSATEAINAVLSWVGTPAGRIPAEQIAAVRQYEVNRRSARRIRTTVQDLGRLPVAPARRVVWY